MTRPREAVPRVVLRGRPVMLALAAVGLVLGAALAPSVLHGAAELVDTEWQDALVALFVVLWTLPLILLAALGVLLMLGRGSSSDPRER